MGLVKYNAHRNYTDLMVYIGLTRLDAAEEFRAHRRARPEDFFGYEVWILGADDAPQRCEGLKVASFFITPRARSYGVVGGLADHMLTCIMVRSPLTYVEVALRESLARLGWRCLSYTTGVEWPT